MIYTLDNRTPQIDPAAWVADSATVIGSVQLAPGSSVWFGCVLRGDNDDLIVGENSNVQDNSVLHTDPGIKLIVGKGCTIGHQVVLHGCSIGDNTLIGIQSVVLNRAVIGSNCMVGAGSLIPEGKQFPDGVLLMGSPAKVVRELTPPEIQMLQQVSQVYVKNAQLYRDSLRLVGAS